MAEEFEAYVLCRDRTALLGTAFLDAFAPRREPAADEFEFPQFASPPKAHFHSPADLLIRLEREASESYSLYWNCPTGGTIFQAMLFFTCDGGMIAGLAVAESQAGATLVEIASIVGGRFGFTAVESAPPFTGEDFIDICKRTALPALVDGALRLAEQGGR